MYIDKPAESQVEDFHSKASRLNLSQETLVQMYKTMCVIRSFEYTADRLYAQGKVHGTMHLSAGQEAVAVGTRHALRSEDYLINHHRGHGHFIAKGADIGLMMAEFLGKETGYCQGRGGSMHIADFSSNNLGANGIVGGGIPIAVGVGVALQMQSRDEIVICIFGDGAANEGVFHESLNMASLWKLPILYICENNQYGMSNPVDKASARLPIAQRAEAYGMEWSYIDGNDLLTVYETMSKAVKHIRRGNGPFLVEASTYRYFGHSKSDRNLYRGKEEIDEWKQKDPILRFRSSLVGASILTSERADEIALEAEKILEEAVAYAEASPEPGIDSLMEFVYA
jgi:acetoin:2,6-dichlorophenolindophenol oxidoreductase subunit alpha